MSEKPLPQLMDCHALCVELGVKRATAERFMRRCERKVVVGRKVFVYRADALAAVREHEVKDRPVRKVRAA